MREHRTSPVAKGVPMGTTNRSWMLEPIEFHHDFEALLASRDGLVAVRDAAASTWDSADPMARSYLELLVVSGPDEWRCECDDTHLVEWYRVLMAPYLIPTRAVRCPDALRRGFPELGWHHSEARRLTRGRELVTLVERHLDHPTVERLRSGLDWRYKGWLDHDDLMGALDRLRRLDRTLFSARQDLVPVVEDAFEVFEAAATKPDHILVTLSP